MSVSTTTRLAVSRRAATLVALLLLGLPLAPATAADIEVRTANLGLVDGQWRLTARIDYGLTEDVEKALKSGVALTFRVDLVIERARTWLPDAEVADIRRDWNLTYEPLSERYLVSYPDDRQPTSYATLFGALNAAGRLQLVPILEQSRLEPGSTYDVALRASLNQRTLPMPLQMLAFWNDGFSLESEWYEWTLIP
jgi:hypothetical protein